MTGPVQDREAGRTDDGGGAAVKVLDREVVHRRVEARVDTFELDSVEAARIWHGLDREPNGPELLEWARATRGSSKGDHTYRSEGNLLTRLGLARLGGQYIGATGTANQPLNATHMRIGVGDSATAAATTDTDLGAAAGSTHRQFKLVDSVAQGTGANSGVTTAIATFATGQANFAWAEWGYDGGTADGTTVTAETATTPGLNNHKIASLLTKTSSVVAVFTITVTVT